MDQLAHAEDAKNRILDGKLNELYESFSVIVEASKVEFRFYVHCSQDLEVGITEGSISSTRYLYS